MNSQTQLLFCASESVRANERVIDNKGIHVVAGTVLENGVRLMDPQPPDPNARTMKVEPRGRSESTRVSFHGRA